MQSKQKKLHFKNIDRVLHYFYRQYKCKRIFNDTLVAVARINRSFFRKR